MKRWIHVWLAIAALAPALAEVERSLGGATPVRMVERRAPLDRGPCDLHPFGGLLDGAGLAQCIRAVLGDPVGLVAMRRAALTAARPEAGDIIAERVLGLPGDIRVDRTAAFSDIPSGR